VKLNKRQGNMDASKAAALQQKQKQKKHRGDCDRIRRLGPELEASLKRDCSELESEEKFLESAKLLIKEQSNQADRKNLQKVSRLPGEPMIGSQSQFVTTT